MFVAPFGELAEPGVVAELAARFDGLVPNDLPGPEALADLAGEIAALRGSTDGFDLVVTNSLRTDPAPWAAAGATWCLTGLGSRARVSRVEKAIDDAL
jgi:hypothetical protein